MDPASADILERAARALAEGDRLMRETERLRAALAASRAMFEVSQDDPFPASAAAAFPKAHPLKRKETR
jgi:hypothetical protein